jgi:hypothetical protein
MTNKDHQQLGKTLWNIADDLRGAMNADNFLSLEELIHCTPQRAKITLWIALWKKTLF